MRRRSTPNRWLALATGLATALALAGTAAPALAGDTRTLTVGSATDGLLPTVTVSAGESITFPLTVSNTGRQTLNNVMLSLGKDGLPLVVEKNPQTDVVPQTPIDLPTNVTISDNATGGGLCTGGAKLDCTIGTLGAGASFSITATVSSTRAAAASIIPTKAVVTVAEIGNDQGSNADTFAAEGSLDLLPFSCERIAAQRTSGESKVVSTCAVTDPQNANGQSATITLPSSLTTVDLNDNAGNVCPAQLQTCYSRAAVQADIEGDLKSDILTWVLDLRLDGAKINPDKVVVYHEDDDENVTLIPLTKKNACKSAGQTNCGVAQIVDVDGVQVLRVTVQTAGNGKVHW